MQLSPLFVSFSSMQYRTFLDNSFRILHIRIRNFFCIGYSNLLLSNCDLTDMQNHAVFVVIIALSSYLHRSVYKLQGGHHTWTYSWYVDYVPRNICRDSFSIKSGAIINRRKIENLQYFYVFTMNLGYRWKIFLGILRQSQRILSEPYTFSNLENNWNSNSGVNSILFLKEFLVSSLIKTFSCVHAVFAKFFPNFKLISKQNLNSHWKFSFVIALYI